MGTKSLSGT